MIGFQDKKPNWLKWPPWCRFCWCRSRWVSGWRRWRGTTSLRGRIRTHIWTVWWATFFGSGHHLVIDPMFTCSPVPASCSTCSSTWKTQRWLTWLHFHVCRLSGGDRRPATLHPEPGGPANNGSSGSHLCGHWRGPATRRHWPTPHRHRDNQRQSTSLI